MTRESTARPWAWAILIALPALIGFTWPGTVEWLCGRGIKHYHAGDFEQAERSFARALDHAPDSDTLEYNRATTLHRREKLDEAAETFRAAAKGGEDELARDAWYGRGNSLYRAGDFAGAVDAYKEALRMDPSDGEAKFNLEMAQQKLQEQEEKQQRPDQQSDEEDEREKKEEQESGESPQEGNEGESQPEQQRPQGQQNEEQPQPEQSRDESQQQAGESDAQQDQRQQASRSGEQLEGELTAAQARRLLRALASEDAEMQKIMRRQRERRSGEAGEKDW